MSSDRQFVRPSEPGDSEAIARLHDEAFGPGRFARTAYRVREAANGAGFGLTAWRDGILAGAVHFTPVTIGGRPGAMMLGPLAVAPQFTGQGFGRWLVEDGVARARDRGVALVFLVGDLPYYARMGFERAPPGQFRLPGPVAMERILVRELDGGALEGFAGTVSGDLSVKSRPCPGRTAR